MQPATVIEKKSHSYPAASTISRMLISSSLCSKWIREVSKA